MLPSKERNILQDIQYLVSEIPMREMTKHFGLVGTGTITGQVSQKHYKNLAT